MLIACTFFYRAQQVIPWDPLPVSTVSDFVTSNYVASYSLASDSVVIDSVSRYSVLSNIIVETARLKTDFCKLKPQFPIIPNAENPQSHILLC